MKLPLLFFFIILLSINFINAEIPQAQIGSVYNNSIFPTIDVTPAPVTQSVNNNTLNVNNSQFLESHPASYFYPASNPLNFVNGSYIPLPFSATQGNLLRYNGTSWTNTTLKFPNDITEGSILISNLNGTVTALAPPSITIQRLLKSSSGIVTWAVTTGTGSPVQSSSPVITTPNISQINNLDLICNASGSCFSLTELNNSQTSFYNSTYDNQIGRIDNLNSTIINSNASWLSTFNSSYLTSSYNSTYDLTSKDVTANRSSWGVNLNSSTLVSGRVPYVTTGGKLTDNPYLGYDGTNLIIGDTTGPNKFSVKGYRDAWIDINNTAVDSFTGFSLGNDARQWRFYLEGGDADKFYIRDHTAGSTRLSIDTNGNTGIGTTSPNYLLDVNGNTSIGTNLNVNQNATVLNYLDVGNYVSKVAPLTVSGSGYFRNSINSNIAVNVVNLNAGTAAQALVGVSSRTSSGFLAAIPDNFAAISHWADYMVFGANSDAAGFIMAASSAGQDIKMYVGGTSLTSKINSTSYEIYNNLNVSSNITGAYKSADGTTGITASGTSCTITAIKNGIITGATCV